MRISRVGLGQQHCFEKFPLGDSKREPGLRTQKPGDLGFGDILGFMGVQGSGGTLTELGADTLDTGAAFCLTKKAGMDRSYKALKPIGQQLLRPS